MITPVLIILIRARNYRKNTVILYNCHLLFNRFFLLFSSPVILDSFYMRHLRNHALLNSGKLLCELFLLLVNFYAICTRHRSAFEDHVLLLLPSLLSRFHPEYELSRVSKFLLLSFVFVNPVSLNLARDLNEVLFLCLDRWLQQTRAFIAFVHVFDLHEYIVVKGYVSIALLLHSLHLLFGERHHLLLIMRLGLDLGDHQLRFILVHEGS